MNKEELGKIAFDRFIAGAKSDTARDYWYSKFKQEHGQEVGQGIQEERMYSEEEVFELLCSMPNFFTLTIAQQILARKAWFEQFKKK